MAELIVEMATTKPSFCGLYANYSKQLAVITVSKNNEETLEREEYKFDKILMDKLREELDAACYATNEKNEKKPEISDDNEGPQLETALDFALERAREKNKFLSIIR